MPLSSKPRHYSLHKRPTRSERLTRRCLPRLAPLFGCLLSVATLFGQTNSAYEQYIRRYGQTAVEQMRKYHIPASIILAQALLESGAGQSELARKSNNHFGIKRGSDWKGEIVTYDDDRRGEQFRAYPNAEASYEDHSQFLLKERYQRLFRLSILDYKGWARGLKACGYATNPHYAQQLIHIVETYHLDDLDEDPKAGWKPRKELLTAPEYEDVQLAYHARLTNNGVLCVVAHEGDTWETLAAETGTSLPALLQMNEATTDVSLRPGDYVYLEKKARKGPKAMKGQWHKVAAGESMHSISQHYGMRVASLYTINYKDPDYQPTPGDLLRVR